MRPSEHRPSLWSILQLRGLQCRILFLFLVSVSIFGAVLVASGERVGRFPGRFFTSRVANELETDRKRVDDEQMVLAVNKEFEVIKISIDRRSKQGDDLNLNSAHDQQQRCNSCPAGVAAAMPMTLMPMTPMGGWMDGWMDG